MFRKINRNLISLMIYNFFFQIFLDTYEVISFNIIILLHGNHKFYVWFLDKIVVPIFALIRNSSLYMHNFLQIKIYILYLKIIFKNYIYRMFWRITRTYILVLLFYLCLRIITVLRTQSFFKETFMGHHKAWTYIKRKN